MKFEQPATENREKMKVGEMAEEERKSLWERFKNAPESVKAALSAFVLMGAVGCAQNPGEPVYVVGEPQPLIVYDNHPIVNKYFEAHADVNIQVGGHHSAPHHSGGRGR